MFLRDCDIPSLLMWGCVPSAGRLTLSVPTDVSCDEWAFSLLPLDVDLLSMELPEFFRDYFLVSAGPLGLGIDRWGQTWGPVGLHIDGPFIQLLLFIMSDSD